MSVVAWPPSPLGRHFGWAPSKGISQGCISLNAEGMRPGQVPVYKVRVLRLRTASTGPRINSGCMLHRLHLDEDALKTAMGILQVATDSLLSDWSSTAATLATVFGVLWLTREVYIWHIHLRHIPGPFTNSISCYYLLFTWGFSGRLNKWVTSQNEKYGISPFSLSPSPSPSQ